MSIAHPAIRPLRLRVGLVALGAASVLALLASASPPPTQIAERFSAPAVVADWRGNSAGVRSRAD